DSRRRVEDRGGCRLTRVLEPGMGGVDKRTVLATEKLTLRSSVATPTPFDRPSERIIASAEVIGGI
ncbi:MAG TPA: hypothetical protein VK969_09365, partial [Acidimicrobiia bacterium]|nr:hypothetical protein [Acidimicrobiia bacterium]